MFYSPPWTQNLEPNQTNVRQWLDNMATRLKPIEQARWNEANIDSMFYAGNQDQVNRYFNFSHTQSYNQFYFNLVQQPVNMVTGYLLQHQKSVNYIPTEGSDSQTTDQYTRMMVHLFNQEGINEQYAKACELSAISGMVLLQPYLDYASGVDPLQGQFKAKVWEYNSFMTDGLFRNPDMSDANFVWCQEFISKGEADRRFPEYKDMLSPLVGSPRGASNFYFLPENYMASRDDLLVVSYIYYKWTRKRKKLYSKKLNQFFDFSEKNPNQNMILQMIHDLQMVEIEVPTWKLAVVVNDFLVYQGNNPLGNDSCPFVCVFWNRDPHLNDYRFRDRSLIRAMRSSQFLLNRQVIISHDQKESTINSGWKRKVGAVANEDNLKKTGQGVDILINRDFEMADVDKIVPNYVPESDFALANRMAEFIFQTSGVNLESWQAEDQKQISTMTLLLKQGANLMVLQKYFAQWDYALKLLGGLSLEIVLNNWNEHKVGMYLGEQPTAHFYSGVFAKYKVVVEEGLNTATQKQEEYMQWIELNNALGGIIPPSEIAKRATIQGKNELIEIIQRQEQMQAEQAQHTQMVAHSLEDAKIKELYARAANLISQAKERHSRSDANIGLFEERLAEVSKNEALGLKAKADALSSLVESISKYGEVETALAQAKLQSYDISQDMKDASEKDSAKRTSASNEFLAKMLTGMIGNQQPNMQGMQQ